MFISDRFRPSILLAAGIATLASVPAAAQTTPESGALVGTLADCRRITDASARLACFDQAAARFVEAERTGEVVVVEREQARAARRQAFGFNLPSLDVFNRAEGAEESDRVTLVIAGGGRDAGGKWTLTTEDGQVWRQVGSPGLRRAPKPGARAEVRRTPLGGYFMNVDGQKAIRVRRER
jgi:hypothetical protein